MGVDDPILHRCLLGAPGIKLATNGAKPLKNDSFRIGTNHFARS
jgi:hypothetical protein